MMNLKYSSKSSHDYINLSMDYYPFGMTMPARSFTSESYRFGFNGKEKDDEVYGGGNGIDYGERVLDTRLGKWLAIDPEFRSYPSNSPYTFGLDNPIMFEDYQGSKIRFSLALRLFHNEVYRTQLVFLKSDAGKEMYREMATKSQAKEYWGEEGKGSLSNKNKVVFGSQKEVGGLTGASVKIGGKWRDTDDLTDEQVKKINGNTKGKIRITVSSSQPINTETSEAHPYGEKVVEGDHLSILMTCGHESTLHGKMHVLFFKTIQKGINGDELIKKRDDIYKPGYSEPDHTAASLGYNESYNDFVDFFIDYAKQQGATTETIKNILDHEKEYNSTSDPEFQEGNPNTDVYKKNEE